MEIRIRCFIRIFSRTYFQRIILSEPGNHNLRPENANQFNVGFTWMETKISIFT